jgi:radical SAM/Cys-rich protein
MAKTQPSLIQRFSPLAAPAVQLETLSSLKLEREFEDDLRKADLLPLLPTRIEILQVNVGKMCNQTCRHCHVDAGPDRKEIMTRETMEDVVRALAQTSISTVDVTGGAPEMNPDFEWLVREVRALGRRVIDRCNLTILDTHKFRHLPEFLAEHQVEIVCSLPHYRALGTDAQRGDGVYEKSIRALQRLNALGYGDGKSGLRLVLVTNPVGAYLPAHQSTLEDEWKRELLRNHGVRFDSLYCITNMPISRYLEWLIETSNLEAYMTKLVAAFNPSAARGVMCRNTLSVGWDGQLYDCDFNQMLELGLAGDVPRHIRNFDLAALERREIVTGRHCFGCTAGAGSSCGGTTA